MHEELCNILHYRNSQDHVIIHIGTNELDSERQTDVIAKSVIDVVNMSRIVPRNDNFNNKALDISDEVLRMCREVKLDFIT